MTSFYDINLMGREFSNEDELYHEILTTIKRDPEVSPSDYVAVALNRFTPVAEGSHRYTAQVTYRVLRVQDGQILLPDKNLIGDSGDQISDDSARTVATELAIAKTDEVLQTELTRAIRTGERSVARDAIASSTSYLIRIDNLDSPTSVSGITRPARSRIHYQPAVPWRSVHRDDHRQTGRKVRRRRSGRTRISSLRV